MQARLVSWLLALLLLPACVVAQVLPPGGGGGGSSTHPVTTCVNAVATGQTNLGILTCSPVTPSMAPGLVPSGGDVSPAGQVISTHLPVPLPLGQGGLGLTAGNAGGILYFATSTTLAASPLLPLNAPLFGGGAAGPPLAGTRSGTTFELATVLGPHTPNKQLAFDPNGNVIATGADIGTGTGDVASVFGRIGAVVAQPGDYTAAQVTNAASLIQANVFAHPSGQTMPRLVLSGTISGTLALQAPAFAGTSLLTLPAGTLDMTTTGGPGQVVKQLTAAGALSVGVLDFNELSGTAAANQVPPLPGLLGILPTTKGGLGWTDTTFSGLTHVLATVVGTLVPGACLTADAQQNIITTGLPCDTGGGGGGSGTILTGTTGVVPQYTSNGTTLGQSTVVAGEIVTTTNPFTAAGRVLQTGAGLRTVTDSGILMANLCTTAGVCTGYQAALGFSPENVANKDLSPTLSSSNTTYPTSGAVKTYADTAAATKQDVVTWGAGLASTGAVARTDSTKVQFLTNGGGTDLSAGAGQSGKMQVMADGTLEYTDGGSPAILRKGYLTQSGLSWNVVPSQCTTDPAGGKLTIIGTQIVCSVDTGGTGSTGISGATAFGAVYATSGSTATSTGALSDGQLLIGRSGNTPLAGTVTGTPGQIRVTPGPGTLVIDFPTAGITMPGTTTGTFAGQFNGSLVNATGLPLTSGVTGVLPVDKGGTNLTSGFSGGVLYYSSANILASSSMLAANQPVLGGGAGGAPTTGTRVGSTTAFATVQGTLTPGNCLRTGASQDVVDAGGPCASANTTHTITGTTNEVAVSPSGPQSLAADRTWTVSLPSTLNLSTKPLLGGTPLVFEGVTVDGNQTSMVVTNPTGGRTFTLPDANSVAVQPTAGLPNQFVSAISSQGLPTLTQPSVATLSDSGNVVLKNAVNAFTGVGAMTGLPNPSNPSDVATKGYVDALTAGFSPVDGVRVSTTGPLTATYTNGASGVGATLTNTGTFAAIAIDGVALNSGDRFLVKDQVLPAQNGIYIVTTVGNAVVAWVGTRATDFDQGAETVAGSYTVVGAEGTTLKNTVWMQITTGAIFMGTTPLVFNQLGATVPPLTNLPSGVVQDGTIQAVPIAPPGLVAGKGILYFETASKNYAVKDDAGVVKHMAQTMTATTSQWLRSMDDSGLFTKSQPAFSDLAPGQATAAQVPNLESLNGTLTTAKGGTGFTDTTFTGAGTSHVLATSVAPFTTNKQLTFNAQGNIIASAFDVGAASSGYAAIQSQGVPVTPPRTTLNFSGAGVSCTDNAGSLRTDCVIPGTTGGLPDPGSNGFVVRTGAGPTVAARTFQGTPNQLQWTNPTGVGGDPTIAFAANVTLPGTTTGTFSGPLTGNVTGSISGNAGTASAFDHDPAPCATDRYVTDQSNTGALTCAQVNLTGGVTNVLPVANGGTGATSLSGVLLGNITAPVTATTTSAGLAGALSDETGSAGGGVLVFNLRPSLTLQDSTFILQDDGNNARQVQFQLSGLSAATRVLTVFDQSDTLVGQSVNQPLTNKTIDAANNTIIGLVPTGRTITTTAPLGGGGNLSGNLTLTCTSCTTSAAPLTTNLPVLGAGLQTMATMTAPGGDRLLGWDNTTLATRFFTIGAGLAYSTATGTLSATGTGGHVIQKDGTSVSPTQRTNLNFTGVGVACNDSAGTNSTICNIPGGAGLGVTGSPTAGQVAVFFDPTTIQGSSTLTVNYAAVPVATSGTIGTGAEHVSTTSGALTRTLPTAASGTSTRRYLVLKVSNDANILSLAPNAGNTINGSATPLTTSAQWSGWQVYETSATNWFAEPTPGGTGTGITTGNKGDLTVSTVTLPGDTWTINPQAVTYSKIQNVTASQRILGRNSAGVGSMEELPPATIKTMLALNFTDIASGQVATGQLQNLNVYGTGLLTGRCVETDGAGRLSVAAGACGITGGSTGISGGTSHGMMIATGGTTATSLGVATNGQLPIGSTGADPVLGTLTPTTNQIDIVNGPGTIQIRLAPGGVTLPGTTLGTFAGSLTGATGLSLTGGVTGTLAVGSGGTGATSLIGILIGNTASPVSATTTSAGIAGQLSDETGSAGGGLLVFNQSPTLVTPTIASLVNATHTHVNAAGGGQLTDAALSAAVTVPKGGTGLTTGTQGGLLYFSATTTLSSSALLTANALMLGGGAGAAPSTMASLGTTTTVLHGNPAGAPTFGAVNLGTDVTGNLPLSAVSGTLAIVNGGTGQTSFALAGLAVVGAPGNTWAAGVKQTFAPNATAAGFNPGTFTADPSTLADADIWYNSSIPALRARINGVTVNIGATGSGLSGATTNAPLYATSPTTFASTAAAMINGQLLVGSTGAAPAIASLQGTTAQIEVVPGPGSLLLRFPTTGVTLPSNTTGTFGGALNNATGTFTGTFTGNAPTATQLAANGANCPVVGTFPNGVDAFGVAENCVPLSAKNAQLGAYTMVAGDFDSYKTITVASGTFTITLVASASQPANGKYVAVLNYGSGVVTIARNGQLINGGTASMVLPAGSATDPSYAWILSDGTDYFANVRPSQSSISSTVTQTGTTGHVAYYANATTVDNSSALSLSSSDILGLNRRRTTMTGNIAPLTSADGPVIGCTTTGTNLTATLPTAAAAVAAGQTEWFMAKLDATAGECRIAPASGERINDVVDAIKNAITKNATLTIRLVSTSPANWHVESGKTAIDLTADVVNMLPAANGGVGGLTGLVQGNGASAPTAVTNSVTTGQVLRVTGSNAYGWGTLDLANSNAVGATILPLTNGGTGSATGVRTSKMWLPAASCAGTTGSLLWDTLATLAPTATCSAGTTEPTLMRGTADFPDADGDYSLQQTLVLPSDWTGVIDARILWRTNATSGNVVWQMTTVCIADNTDVDDLAYSSPTVFTADSANVTPNRTNHASQTITTATCAASELMHVKIFRNRTDSNDNIPAGGIISLIGVELTLRRTWTQ